MLIIGIFCIIAGFAVGYLFAVAGRNAERMRLKMLQEAFDALQAKEQGLQEEHIALLREAERLKENLRLTEEKLASQKKEMGEVGQLLAEQFRNLATEILDDKSKRFTETNRENIEKILQPLNKYIAEFRKKVDEAYHK
ncbi:MAG: DNA recombination protein RmuC, partial [Odoribacter sp.]|nr:DNA recombination protein RmuC [Odoribacter sp.]